MNKNKKQIDDIFTESSLFQFYQDAESSTANVQIKLGVIHHDVP